MKSYVPVTKFQSSQNIDTSARQIWPKKMKQNAYHHRIFYKFPSIRKKHSILVYYLNANYKGANQTARMRRLICAFVVRI